MTTRNQVSRAHRIYSILWVAAMLLASLVASGKSIQARCPDQKMAHSAWTVAAAPAHGRVMASLTPRQADEEALLASSTAGLDLEVRIWNVRIGFPWLKSLPVTPGRRIVVSLWETEPDR
jgi:hypothetical protein